MEKEKILVTVVGISGLNPGMREVEIGDELYLEKDFGNPDPYAIRAFLGEDGESVGYVANKSTTVVRGTLSATNVHPLFNESIFGVVLNTTEVTFVNEKKSKAFIVELDQEEMIEEEDPMAQVIKFKLVGANTQYPKKLNITEDLKKGIVPYVTLTMKDDKIVALYDGEPAGHIEKRNQSGLTDYEEIVAVFVDGQIAKITQSITTNVIGEFNVNKEEFSKNQSVRTLQSECKRIIDDGIATQQEIDERISYMDKAGVTEKQMLRVFESYTKYREGVAAYIPDMKPPKVLYRDGGQGIVLDCISYMNGDRNLLFEGDRGVGKNVLIETLAWLYKRPLYEFPVNSQHDNNALLGGKTIESDEEGKTKMGFDLEATVQAALEGGILNLDEINAGLAHTLIVFNSLLDDRRRMLIPGYGYIQAHENFIVIASMNRDYQGTFELNEATADRFVPIVFPKMESLKEVLMAKVPQVGLTVINECEKFYMGLKKVVIDGEVSDKAISIRGFVDACIGVDQGLPLKRALITNVVNRCTDVDDRKKITALINASIR
ncbi:AAA family ATPase [Brevibacillus sp. NPDC058079]|uniref:AAA family ATPase n=1 Tax=Brevibacillus sp. NPDC058079 TaxID=3346330 RepID=UPI0036EC4E4A